MKSMTGIGERTESNERFRITMVVRSVNHRHLEVSLRLKEGLRELEGRLKGVVRERLARGRVDVSVEIEPLAEPHHAVEIDQALLTTLVDAIDPLRQEGTIAKSLVLGDLFRVPGLIRVTSDTDEWIDEDDDLAVACCEGAVAELIEDRASEGVKIGRSLRGALEVLESVTLELRKRRESVVSSLPEDLRERLRRLAPEEIDDQRILQEVALIVEKGDVTEELERLSGHLRRFEEQMKSAHPIGRRLDFLTQEILRELNTVGSKCRDGEMLDQVVEGKVACEQLREQVQNVE